MPLTKAAAIEANDSAFESAYQKHFEMLFENLKTAGSDAEKSAAVERAGAGLSVLRDAHDRMETVINALFH